MPSCRGKVTSTRTREKGRLECQACLPPVVVGPRGMEALMVVWVCGSMVPSPREILFWPMTSSIVMLPGMFTPIHLWVGQGAGSRL